MKTNQEGVNPIQEQLPTKSGDFMIFAKKAGVILIGIIILANFLLPDLSDFQNIFKRFETPKSKLVLLSFVQNPRALLNISKIEEAEGQIDNAIRDTELAIGLLELHGVDKQVVQKYSDRVDKLMSKKLSMAVTPAQSK
jgi:hypothetical protein